MKRLLLITSLFSFFLGVAQERHLVVFTDKVEEGFDPYSYFDTAAIKNKELMGLPLYDWADLPVTPEYSSAVESLVDSVRFDLRWFNGTVVYASQEQMNDVIQLPFVKSTLLLSKEGQIMVGDSMEHPELDTSLTNNMEIFNWQLKTMGGEYFKKNNIDGTGIRVCVIDVGFPGIDENISTSHIFKDRYIDGWNFINNRPLKFRGFNHGTQVTNYIAGKIDTTQVGLAPNIELLLARTEWLMTEKMYEEEVWVKAIEWAHQKGARLVNSSLGYHDGKHDHSELDGKSSMLSSAANMAARKGLLIVNAAGNEGRNIWKRIILPADADSVLTVGGIDPYSGVKSSFSSFGPTTDGKLKPNVCALGTVYYYDNEELTIINGTSFASPLITGFAACILQMDPTLKPMELMDTIQKISSLYPYYDYSHGYGVPQAGRLFGEKRVDNSNSIELRMSPSYSDYKYYYFHYNCDDDSQVFYHIEDKDGYLKAYSVVHFKNKTGSPRVYTSDLKKGDILRVFHRGTLIEKKIK